MRLYGIKEIADEVAVDRHTVAQWYRRGKLPPPDHRLAMGPIWEEQTIALWFDLYRYERLGRYEAEQVRNDKPTVAAMDAYEKARDIDELPPLEQWWAANAARAHAEGQTPEQWREEELSRHNHDPQWRARIDRSEVLLREFGLWPWEEESK